MIEVPAADSMDASTFLKHFNKRHMPMAGTTVFRVQDEEDGSTRVLRAFHERVHGTHSHTHEHRSDS